MRIRLDTSPPIAVFHTEEGELFAIDDTCTHQVRLPGGRLGQGCEVECPLHASKFNLRTGAVDALRRTCWSVSHEVHSWLMGTSWSSSRKEAPNLPPGLTVDGHV